MNFPSVSIGDKNIEIEDLIIINSNKFSMGDYKQSVNYRKCRNGK